MARKAKPKKPALTPNQLPTSAEGDALLAFVDVTAEGEIPSYPKVSERLGKTRSAAQQLLDQCEAKGLLHRPPVTVPGPRQLTKEGERWVKILREQQAKKAS